MAVKVDSSGTNQYIDFQSPSNLDNLSTFSLGIWLYLTGWGENANGRWVDKDGGNSNPGWVFQVGDYAATNRHETFAFFARWGAGATFGYWTAGDYTISLNEWNHLGMYYDRSSASNDPKFWLNGTLMTTYELYTPSGSAMNDAAINLLLGETSAGVARGCDGYAEDLRLYSRELTAEEWYMIGNGYRGPLGGEIGWWSFDDWEGVSHPNGTTLGSTNYCHDKSSNDNRGTPTNSPVAYATEAPRFFPIYLPPEEPSGPTISVSEITLASSAQTITAVGGAISTVMNALSLVGSLESFVLVPGEVTPAMNELTLASLAPVIVISNAPNVSLSEITLSSSPQVLAVIPGAVSAAMSELTITSSPETLSVLPGSVASVMNTISLAGSAETMFPKIIPSVYSRNFIRPRTRGMVNIPISKTEIQ